MYKYIFNFINYSVIFCSFMGSVFFTEPGLANDDFDGNPDDIVNGRIESDKMVVTKKIRKTVTPDTPAIKFWLTNRQPGRWVDKKEFDVNQAPAVPESTDDLDTNAKRDLCKHVLG